MRSFLNNQSIDCTAGRLSISSAAPVLCGGNVGCIPRVSFIWLGFSTVCLTLIWSLSVVSPEEILFYATSTGWVVSVITFGISWGWSHSTFSRQFFIPLETQILFLGDLYHFRSTHKCTRIFFYLFIFFMENMCRTLVSFTTCYVLVKNYENPLSRDLFWYFSNSHSKLTKTK